MTKVTIVPRGQALGVTMYTPLDDRYNYSKEYLLNAARDRAWWSRRRRGGHRSHHHRRGKRLAARHRHCSPDGTRWGMSERLGTISYSERENPFAGTSMATGGREYSEKTAGIIDEEVDRIVKWAYGRAVGLLSEHRATLDRVAQALRLYETIDAKQLREIMI